jgi:hypothetical protein
MATCTLTCPVLSDTEKMRQRSPLMVDAGKAVVEGRLQRRGRRIRCPHDQRFAFRPYLEGQVDVARNVLVAQLQAVAEGGFQRRAAGDGHQDLGADGLQLAVPAALWPRRVYTSSTVSAPAQHNVMVTPSTAARGP